MYPTIKDIHFVGIGGIGMSGLAEILLTMGCRVTGSDLRRSPLTDRLRRRGAKVHFGHKAENVSKTNPPQLVVTSSAVAKGNPEVAEAAKRGIPVISRGEMLAMRNADAYRGSNLSRASTREAAATTSSSTATSRVNSGSVARRGSEAVAVTISWLAWTNCLKTGTVSRYSASSLMLNVS